jgi:hypothetical protein
MRSDKPSSHRDTETQSDTYSKRREEKNARPKDRKTTSYQQGTEENSREFKTQQKNKSQKTFLVLFEDLSASLWLCVKRSVNKEKGKAGKMGREE